jgi:urocanate hydratase
MIYIILKRRKLGVNRLFNEMFKNGQVKVPINLAFGGSYY